MHLSIYLSSRYYLIHVLFPNFKYLFKYLVETNSTLSIIRVQITWVVVIVSGLNLFFCWIKQCTIFNYGKRNYYYLLRSAYYTLQGDNSLMSVFKCKSSFIIFEKLIIVKKMQFVYPRVYSLKFVYKCQTNQRACKR